MYNKSLRWREPSRKRLGTSAALSTTSWQSEEHLAPLTYFMFHVSVDQGLWLTCRSASSADPQEAGNLIAQQLLLENRLLTKQLETSERENFDISEYLRHELSVKDQRLTALHNNLDEVRGQPACMYATKQ